MASISEIQTQAAKQNAIKFVEKDKVGFAGMTSEDFMKILIVQLQNQDPSNPMESDQLLNQVSQMRALQSSLELETALKGVTLSQQLNGSASLIGKTVTAVTGDDDVTVSGKVDSVVVKDGSTLLKINGQQIPIADITGIAP
jgi:flagellar basal-body rod modification protein FlgD